MRLHSAIGYITPQDKLHGKEKAIFAARDQKLALARLQLRLKATTLDAYASAFENPHMQEAARLVG